MPLGQIFLELGLVIVVLALVGRAAGRLGITPIPLYLLSGIALGAVMHLSDAPEEFIHIGAEIGAVLLLFVLGLEYTSQELRDNLRANRRVGLLDLALNVTPGVVAGWLLGLPLMGCVLLGGVTYLTSSGIASKVLSDLGRLGNRETPVILAVCVIEDVVNLMIALIAFGAAFYCALRYGPQLSRLLNVPSDETLLLGVLGLVLVVAGIADQLKVSAAIGAFLVGIALSGDVAHRARRQVEPLRDLFAAVFFVFFGLQLDVATVPGVLLPATLLAVITAATKFLVGWTGAARAGVQTRGRIRAGATLIPRGEFSILIAGLGLGIAPTLGPLAAVYVLITAVIGPVLARLDAPLARWLDRARPPVRRAS